MKITHAQLTAIQNDMDGNTVELLPLLDQERELGQIIVRHEFGDGVVQDVTISSTGHIIKRVLRDTS